MRVLSTVVLSALVASVAAQYSDCLQSCMNDAVVGTGCTSTQDFQCICSNQEKFGGILSPCVTDKCPEADFTGASQFMKVCWSYPVTTPGASQTDGAPSTPAGEPTTEPDAPSTSEPASDSGSGSGSGSVSGSGAGSGSNSASRPTSTGSGSATPSSSPPGDAAVGVSVGAWGWALAAVAGAAAAL